MKRLFFHKNPTEENINIILKEVFEESYTNIPLRVHYTSYNKYVHQLIRHHWHEEIEILYIAKGTMTLTVENTTFVASEGDIVVIPPSFLHSATNDFKQACDFYAIVFDLNFLSSSEKDSIQKNYILPIFKTPESFSFQVKNSPELYTILNHIIEKYASKSVGYDIYIKSQLLLFFYELASNLELDFIYNKPTKKLKADNSLACRHIISYIEQNYANKITLEEIADFAGFNKAYFCRFFKRNFGVSFFKYLNQYRINRAEYLLRFTEKKILDICMETGFDNITYFSTLFKKITGLTPSVYRKSARNVANKKEYII